jgi:hypothetical protein
MWDSPAAAAAAAATGARASARVAEQAAPAAGSEPARTESIPVRLADGALTVTPSRDMLTSPATSYPLYIDPGFSGGQEIWTHVNRANPTKSYWTDANRTDMRVGQVWDGASDDDWRTLVQYNVDALNGATIQHAVFLTTVRHSASCAATPIQLWRTNMIDRSAAVTWNSTKDKYWALLDEVDVAANKSSCPQSNDQAEFTAASVRNAFQDAADKNYDTITFGLRAASETDEYQWKKLVPDSSTLEIAYNRPPLKPTGTAITPCGESCDVIPVGRPALRMAVDDPDGSLLTYEYEVYDSTRTTLKTKSSGTALMGVVAGSTRTWTPPTTLADGGYAWRGRGCDTVNCGPYSDWAAFTVDTTAPAAPTVTGDVYLPEGQHGGVGVAGTFTFAQGTATDGARTYRYALNGGPQRSVTAAADGTAQVVVTPTAELVNVLTVASVDRAGNISESARYAFEVAPAGGGEEPTTGTAG